MATIDVTTTSLAVWLKKNHRPDGESNPAACVTGRNTDHYTIKDGWPESLEEPYLGLYTVVTALLTTHPAN